MSAPLYKIGSNVYLKSSADSGSLESYTIANIARVGNKWIYHIYLTGAEATYQTYGDKNNFIHKTAHNFKLEFPESELITYCDALTMVASSLSRRISYLNAQITSKNCTSTTPVESLHGKEPRNINLYDIDDVVYLASSARFGFLEPYQIEAFIYDRASRVWIYTLDMNKQTAMKTQFTKIRNSRIMYFREGELMSKCDALITAKAALDRKYDDIQVKITSAGCGST